jgi:hypothetical protein
MTLDFELGRVVPNPITPDTYADTAHWVDKAPRAGRGIRLGGSSPDLSSFGHCRVGPGRMQSGPVGLLRVSALRVQFPVGSSRLNEAR